MINCQNFKNTIYNSIKLENTCKINSTKHVQGLYTKIYKKLLRKSKEDLNKWRGIPYSWVKRLNIINMSILSKLMHRFSAISFQILAGVWLFFSGVEIDKLNLNLYGNTKELD